MSAPSAPSARAPLAALLAAVLVAACGGAGSDPGDCHCDPVVVSDLDGPVTGITTASPGGADGLAVAGVRRFDEGADSLFDEDGRPLANADLRVGMQVALAGVAVPPNAMETTRSGVFRLRTALVGRVESIDPAGGRLGLLGQAVVADQRTALDPAFAGGLAGVAAGSEIEVDGQFDEGAQAWRATRIAPAAGAARYKLKGRVAAFDAAAQTLRIGTAEIDLQGADLPAGGLVVGQRVYVQLDPAASGGRRQATSVADDTRSIGATAGAATSVTLRGLVGDIASASDFSVDGFLVHVPAGAGTVVPLPGLPVVVVADLDGQGRLVARAVAADDPAAADTIEVDARVDALDPVGRTFLLNGLRVSFADGADFGSGSAAGLADGVPVTATGTLSADGTQLEASRIAFVGAP
jgi:hypothetical protein